MGIEHGTLQAVLEERLSTRTGKPYKVVVLKLTPEVDKLVFLTAAELALLELNQ